MAELQNDFSWSPSRAEMFARCPRRYWFHYYGAWGGWERAAAPRARTLYVLKQLDTRLSWMGATVHNCLRWILDTLRNTGAPPGQEQALQLIGRRMNRDFQESGEGLYWENPKTHRGLLEHEYEEREIPDDAWREVFERALLCVTNFYQSEVLVGLQALPADAWLEVENLSSYELEGTRIWTQLDCAHRTPDGIAIYDWKTGKADRPSTREQLAAYILYAAQRWGIAPERIAAREFNLLQGTLHETRLDEEGLRAARAAIQASIEDLRARHGADEAQFAFTENEARCARCNFTRLCPRFAVAPAD